MLKKIRRATTIVLTITILLTMFAGCSKPEEKFAKQRSMITMTTTEIWDNAIVSALLIGESKYWVEDHYLYIADYLRETEYYLAGNQIILVEPLL